MLKMNTVPLDLSERNTAIISLWFDATTDLHRRHFELITSTMAGFQGASWITWVSEEVMENMVNVRFHKMSAVKKVLCPFQWRRTD